MNTKPKRKRGEPVFSSFVQADIQHFGLGMVLGVLGLILALILLVVIGLAIEISAPRYTVTETVCCLDDPAQTRVQAILHLTQAQGTQYAMMTQTATTPTPPEQPQ